MRTITKCRSCGSKKLEEFLDLGEQYTSDFRTDDSKPNKYPIVAVICRDCMLVQLKHTTPPEDMYHENYGFKSGVSNSIKDDLKDIVFNAQEYKHNPKSWLDIASNDGTLLSFVPTNTYRVGVDPVEFLCAEAEQHADAIYSQFFDSSLVEKPFDVITSISCFYDMDDPNKFVDDVKECLADDGVWVIQQNYLLPTLKLNAVDNFCHEHLEYYTLLSLEKLLERHGLEVFDLSTSMVNGGSIRTLVCKKDAFPVQDSVEQQRYIERKEGLHTLKPYKRFADTVMDNLNRLKDLIDQLAKEGKTIYILAASTRGATIWQAIGLDNKLIKKAVERNPAKVGKYFSAIGVPIISEEEARSDRPDYMIIGPWFFAEEIIEREREYLNNGGHMILPLPELRII